jgi:HEAT repeat protein
LAARFLEDTRVANVLAALDVVAANGAASDAALVRPLLAHAHPRVRAAALMTMDTLGASDRGDLALRALDDVDPEVRVAACRVLGRSPTDASVPKLCEQLDDGYPPLHQAAREALVAGGQAGIADVITRAVEMISGADPRRQEDGSYILGQLRRDEALERHIELTRSDDLATASQAARSLTRIGRREAGPAMLQMFQRLRQIRPATLEVDSATRDAVLGAGELGERGIVPALKGIVPDLERESANVRAAGAWVLGVLGDASDAKLVQALTSRMTVEQESSDVQFEAAKALGALRAREALPLLRELGRSSFDPALRYMSHLSADRIEGSTTPFVRMVITTPLETLVEETQAAESSPELSPGP